MSDEETKEITSDMMMYVHQIDYTTLKSVLERVTDVHLSFVYNMPKKATSYKDDGFALIKELDHYANSDEEWRITKDKNINLQIIEDRIHVGEWVIGGTELVLCIPRINSIIIIPNEDSTYKNTKEPTKILQLTNCISVTPLLLVLGDEPDENNEGKFKLSIGYEMISNKKPTQE